MPQTVRLALSLTLTALIAASAAASAPPKLASGGAARERLAAPAAKTRTVVLGIEGMH